MASGQDIYYQLYEKIPVWLASLGTLSGKGRKRKSSAIEGLPTPELSAHNATTLDTSTAKDSTPTERGLVNTSQGPLLTTLTQPSADVSLKAGRITVLERRRRPSNSSTSSEVYYNAEAQETLYEVVKDIGKVAYTIKKCRQRIMLDDPLRRLNEASNACEDGALQLLRQGQCTDHAQAAATIMEDMFKVSCSEVMHSQIAAKSPTAQSPVMVRTAHKPRVRYLDVDPMASDEDGMDTPLSQIRLTSRLAR